MKNVIAAIIAGVVMFFWGFVSWSVLPWHNTDVHSFSDETAVMQVLVDNAPASGIYYIPAEEAENTMDTANAMVNIKKQGFQISIGQMMAQGILGSIVMAYLAIWLLAKTKLSTYTDKVVFVTMMGLLIGISSSFNYWNWFGFPTGYSFVNLLDYVITWALAGLVIGKIAET